MTRSIHVLSVAAFAALALAACQQPSVLAKAQSGECYQVVGKDSLGQAKLAKTACAEGATTPGRADQGTQDAKDGVQTASTQGSGARDQQDNANAAVCPRTCQAGDSTSYIAGSKVRSVRAVYRARGGRGHRVGGTGLGLDYARIGDTETQKGGGESLATRSDEQHTSSQSVRDGLSVQSSTAYSSSESSSDSASLGLTGGACCQAALGPHQPFDRFGFLTWHGKVEYAPEP